MTWVPPRSEGQEGDETLLHFVGSSVQGCVFCRGAGERAATFQFASEALMWMGADSWTCF